MTGSDYSSRIDAVYQSLRTVNGNVVLSGVCTHVKAFHVHKFAW